MKRVLFWRHGQTDWNAERRFQGQSDIPLNEVGLAQARTAARLLASLRPDAVVSSDLERARQTAQSLADLVPGIGFSTDPRLRETSAGQWESEVFTDILERYPELLAAWESGDQFVRGGVTGETRAEVADRVAEGVRAAVERIPEDGLLVVASHGAAIKCGLLRLLDVPADRWGIISGLVNCHWSVLEEKEHGWQLVEHNAGTLPEPVMGDES